MNSLFLLLIFFTLWAWLNRFMETTNFVTWWHRSIFVRLETKYPKLYLWLRSWNKDEVRYIYIWKFKIKLHPIFRDGYHFSKNFLVLFFLLILWYIYGWPYFIGGAFWWWINQNVAYNIMVGK